MVYDPEVQTCLFDGSWSTGSQDRRRLGASRDGFCEAVEREDLDKLKTELKTELQASKVKFTGLTHDFGSTLAASNRDSQSNCWFN